MAPAHGCAATHALRAPSEPASWRSPSAPKTLTTRFLILLITVYQHTLSRLLGPRCRFWPSCSAYAKGSLELYPLPTALKKTTLRLLRCHPFHPGGIDLP